MSTQNTASNDIIVAGPNVSVQPKDYTFIYEVPAVEGASYVIFGDDKELNLAGDGLMSMGHLITMEYRALCHGPTSQDLDFVIDHVEAYGVPQERAMNLVLGMVHCLTEGNEFPATVRVSHRFYTRLMNIEDRLWQHDFEKVMLDDRAVVKVIDSLAIQAVTEWMKNHDVRIRQNK